MPRKGPIYEIVLPAGARVPNQAKLPGSDYPFWRRLPSPPAGGKLSVISLSAELLTINTHYINHSTLPCTADWFGSCDWCRELRIMHNGFLACLLPGSWDTCILTLTKNAIVKSKGLAERQDLLGKEITVYRTGKSARGPLWCKVSPAAKEWVPKKKSVSPAFLREVLFNIWGVRIVRPAGDQAGDQAGELLDLNSLPNLPDEIDLAGDGG